MPQYSGPSCCASLALFDTAKTAATVEHEAVGPPTSLEVPWRPSPGEARMRRRCLTRAAQPSLNRPTPSHRFRLDPGFAAIPSL